MTSIRGQIDRDHPCFAIGVAARMVGLHAQTLRYYERAGLIEPSRSKGKNRLYSQRNIERLMRIRSLTDDLGLNLAGVEVIMRMGDRIGGMEREIEELRRDLARARGRPRALTDGRPSINIEPGNTEPE